MREIKHNQSVESSGLYVELVCKKCRFVDVNEKAPVWRVGGMMRSSKHEWFCCPDPHRLS